MLRIRERAVFIIAFFSLFFLVIPDAYAYLDPGTGSMILQIVIATFISMLFTLKIFWKRIVAFLKKIRRSNPSSGRFKKQRL